MTLYLESVKDQTDHFADAFVRKTLRTVMTFESLRLMPFSLDNYRVRKQIFKCFISVFSANLVGIW